MIPLNFYRDDEYVYYNNPNGITKKMTIADFESVMSGTGSGGEGFEIIGPIASHVSADTTINSNATETLILTDFADINTEESVELQTDDYLFLVGYSLGTSALLTVGLYLSGASCELTVYNKDSSPYTISSNDWILTFGVIRKSGNSNNNDGEPVI